MITLRNRGLPGEFQVVLQRIFRDVKHGMKIGSWNKRIISTIGKLEEIKTILYKTVMETSITSHLRWWEM